MTRRTCLALICLLFSVGCQKQSPAPQATKPAEVEQFERGLQLSKEGKDIEARQAFDTAIRLKPSFAPPTFLLAEYARREGDFATATQRLETLLHAAPGTSDVLCRLSEIALQQGRFVMGWDLAQQELHKQPRCPLALAQQGIAFQMAGETVRAIQSLEEAHKEAPRAELFALTLTQVYALAGKNVEAWQILDSLPNPPRYPAKTDYLRGWIMATYGRDGKKDPQKALAFLDKSLHATPNYVPSILEKGKILFAAGKTTEGNALLQKARQGGALQPEELAVYTDTFVHKDASLEARAKASEARLRQARQAYIRAPDVEENQLLLAQEEGNIGNYQDARDLVMRVLKKDPRNPKAVEMFQKTLSPVSSPTDTPGKEMPATP